MLFCCCSPLTAYRSLILIYLQIVEIDFRQRVAKDPGRSLAIGNGIDTFNRPLGWFTFACEPNFASRSRFPIRKILDLQLHAIPGIGFPGERNLYSALRLGLPRLEV